MRQPQGRRHRGARVTWIAERTTTEEGERAPSSLAMCVNAAIITMVAKSEDVREWAKEQTATALIVLRDPEILRAREALHVPQNRAAARRETAMNDDYAQRNESRTLLGDATDQND